MRAVLIAFFALALAVVPPALGDGWSDPVPVTRATQYALTPDGAVSALFQRHKVRYFQRAGQPWQRVGDVDYFYDDSLLAGAGNDIAAAWTTGADRVQAAVAVGGGDLGLPADLGPGRLAGVVGNASGDVAVLIALSDGTWAVAFRPAGGNFGTPEAVPELNEPGSYPYEPRLALSPSGESLVSWVAEGQPLVASRLRTGPFATPVSLPGPATAVTAPRVTLDAQGRALAAWMAPQDTYQYGTVRAAVRDPAGQWRLVTGLEETTSFFVRVGTSDDGQAVLGWAPDGAGYTVAPISLADGAVGTRTILPPKVVSGDIDQIYDPDTITSLEQATGPDGSTVVMWHRENSVLMSRRVGAGVFGPAEVVACQSTESPSLLSAGGAFAAIVSDPVTGDPAVIRDSPATATKTCPAPEPYTSAPPFNYSHTPIAGEPVRVDMVNVPPRYTTLESVQWSVGPVTTLEPHADLTFPKPGRITLAAHALVRNEDNDYESGLSSFDVVEVFQRAKLKARGLRRRIRATASAYSSGPKALVTILLKRDGKVRAQVSGLLGLKARRVELKVKRPGRYRVELRQGGKPLAKATVRVT